MKTEQATAVDDLLALIARKHLRITTLEHRGSDSLDFYDVSVGEVRDALQAAYEAGAAAAKASRGAPSAPREAAASGHAWRGSGDD